jgi:peptide/nickel transport system substrate-binding protein
MRRAFVLLAVAIITASLVPVASAQEEVVLRIGLTQDWETLNPTSGFAVSEYEVWNVQYAPLVNLSAADFSNEPGLAESWEASDDGLTFTYTLPRRAKNRLRKFRRTAATLKNRVARSKSPHHRQGCFPTQ